MTGLDLDRIEATARAAAEAVSAEIWHLDTGRATGVYTEARPSPTSEDVASAYHREVESHIATMDPSTTIALVARVRGAEARLAEVDALHSAEHITDAMGSDCIEGTGCDHEDPCPTVDVLVCGGCRDHAERAYAYALEDADAMRAVTWPCPTHLAIHPECADECVCGGEGR